MALSPNDNLNEAAYAPEYPASVAFVLRKTRQLRAEIGSQIDLVEAAHEALKSRVAALEALSPHPIVDMGAATVAQMNAATKSANQVYHATTSGTLVVGNVAVAKGDTFLWNGSSWAKTGSAYDLSSVAVPTDDTKLGQLRGIVKDLLAAMGRS